MCASVSLSGIQMAAPRKRGKFLKPLPNQQNLSNNVEISLNGCGNIEISLNGCGNTNDKHTNVENVAGTPKIIPDQSFRIVDDCQTLMRPKVKSRIDNY